MKANKAYAGENDSVIYEYQDGRKEQWLGGSRNWRNQNPGNVFYYSVNDWLGQIGYAARICVFSDPEYGRRATRIILSKYAARKFSLEKGITTYAPSIENNSEAYVADVVSTTGIPRQTLLNTLTPLEMENVAQAIFKHEGKIVIGEIHILKLGTSLKTGKYIWHTAHDGSVRKAHAEREGKIFDFSQPPPGGNPGDEYGCRCWAEPIPDRPIKDIFTKNRS